MKVSVCLITYNHAKYITQTIESILMQKVNFDWELIIADDFSTDGTREIIDSYKTKYPDLIKLILQEKNVGAAQNFVDLIAYPKSEYIAYIEGDDYWIDESKLQKQIDFLDHNPAYILHSGCVQTYNQKDGSSFIMGNNELDESFELHDFYTQNNLISCTIVFRNIKYVLPEFYKDIFFGDWFLYVILMKQSGLKAYKSKDIFSVYRIHDNSAMASIHLIKNVDSHIRQIEIIKDYVQYPKLSGSDKNNISNYLTKKYRATLNQKAYLESLKVMLLNFKYCGFKVHFRKYLNGFAHHFLK